MPDKQLSRKALYEQVWSVPASRLATDFGLSDVGLAKLCKRHQIPRPPRGYWAKLEAGKAPPQTPLPPGENDDEIVVAYVESPGFERSGLASPLEALLAEEARPENRIQISENLRGAHPLVVAVREEFTGAKSNAAGILTPEQPVSLDLSVTRNQFRRALLVINALLKALESRGLAVSEGPEVRIFEEQIAFGIKERIKLIKEQPEEADLSGSYQFSYNRYIKREVATGELVVFIKEPTRCLVSGQRKQWKDASKQNVEDCLNKIIRGFYQYAGATREARLEDEEREKEFQRKLQRREQEKEQRAELRRQQAVEQQRIKSLIQEVQDWKTSQEIREYLEQIRENQTTIAAGAALTPEWEQWLSWAKDQADRLDPFMKSPPSILDIAVPEESRGWH